MANRQFATDYFFRIERCNNMREFVRYITGFSLVALSAVIVLLTGLSVLLLTTPQLLLQILYYGAIFLCIVASLIILFFLLRAAWSRT